VGDEHRVRRCIYSRGCQNPVKFGKLVGK
jgi:hypothetical protein